jgi:hypothetical protein
LSAGGAATSAVLAATAAGMVTLNALSAVLEVDPERLRRRAGPGDRWAEDESRRGRRHGGGRACRLASWRDLTARPRREDEHAGTIAREVHRPIMTPGDHRALSDRRFSPARAGCRGRAPEAEGRDRARRRRRRPRRRTRLTSACIPR